MIERLSSQELSGEIQVKLDPFFEDLKVRGISYIGHGVVSDEGAHTGYFSNPQWGEMYIQRQFFFIEPILEKYEDNKMSLISWKGIEEGNPVACIRNEFTKITSGLTLCKREQEFNTFFNIGFDKNVDLGEYTILNKDVLLAYFNIFNNSHLLWRKLKSF